jgi:hypothetical protein
LEYFSGFILWVIVGYPLPQYTTNDHDFCDCLTHGDTNSNSSACVLLCFWGLNFLLYINIFSVLRTQSRVICCIPFWNLLGTNFSSL